MDGLPQFLILKEQAINHIIFSFKILERDGVLQCSILREKLILLGKRLEQHQEDLELSCLVVPPLGRMLVLLISFNIGREIQVISQ